MNVIWIVSDTFRRDYLGVYGNETIHTPSLDALAARSVRFDRHYMASFPTMPARADFMTGRWTMSFMQWEALPKDVVALAPILAGQGFHTAAIVDTPFYVRNGMYYDRGFQTYSEIPGQRAQGQLSAVFSGRARNFDSECIATQTFNEALHWLEGHYKEDFFLLIDVWDPHEPWDAPSYYTEPYWPDFDGEIVRPVYGYWQKEPGMTEEKVKKALAAYCGEVTMVDTNVGNFIRRLENMSLMDNTAVIFTTDHGYYFGDHGGMFGKMVFARDPDTGQRKMGIWSHSPFYEEVSALPLFIYIPGVSPAVYSGLTSAVDLMPTVLDILGQEIPSEVEGKSLLPAIHDQSVAGRDFVVSAHPFTNPGDMVKSIDDFSREGEMYSTAAITTDEWSLLYVVEPGMSELFYLPSDPKQEKNIISTNEHVARELHQQFVKLMRETKTPARLLEPRLELIL